MENYDSQNAPNLQCHFAGSLDSSKSWIKLHLEESDQDRFIRKVKLFNIKNGAKSSNLENAKIYVGDDSGNEIMCAKVGSNLPVNQFITFMCEDENAQPRNAFGESQVEFEGIKGTYMRIEAQNNKILSLCDPVIEVKAIDESQVATIEAAISVCEGYYDMCR